MATALTSVAATGSRQAPPTSAEIEAARTPQGGWTKAQLDAWGVAWPPESGGSGKEADDRFLAACNALLLSIATDSMLADEEADLLLDAMPDAYLRRSLRRGLIRDQRMAASR